MTPENKELSLLLQASPEKALPVIRRALEEAASRDEAARRLRVSRRTLFRWLRRYPELGGSS